MRRSSFRLLPLALLLLLAAGCAARSLDDVSDDMVQILPDRGKSGDFLVMFLNRQTMLVNGDLAADRINVTRARLLEAGCRDPHLLREKAEPQEGTWSFGRKRVIYLSEWACT